MNRLHILLMSALLGACASVPPQSPSFSLLSLPETDTYCLYAQRVVTRTAVPMELVVHKDFNAFVKSKALMDGPGGLPEIQQFNWYDVAGNLKGISCKMKNAEHLNLEFGAGSAGPEGFCQDMNQQVYQLVKQQLAAAEKPIITVVTFDTNERDDKQQQRNQSGPEWLLPFTLTYYDAAGGLHIATKGFVIDFADPRYQRFPASWRGTHYCHLIAPEYLAGLLQGEAEADAVVGRKDVRR